MKGEKQPFVCPVWMSKSLDLGLRRWLHDPQKILAPYVREGMAALDLGCGPGFFTVEMARLAGKTGKVTAADLQEGMLARAKSKVTAAGLDIEGDPKIRFSRAVVARSTGNEMLAN